MRLPMYFRYATALCLSTTFLIAQRPAATSPTPGMNPGMIPNPSTGASLSGKFVMDGGGPPPDRVRVELICNSVPKPQGWSDSKGNFNVQLGSNSPDEISDLSYARPVERPLSGVASTTAPTPIDNIPRDLTGCEVRGALPGYRSTTVALSGHKRLDSPDVGTILLKRIENVEGNTTSATSTAAPDSARKSYEKAMEAAKKSNWDDAQKELKKAVDAYPKYALAWFQLGRVHEVRNRLKEATEAYRQSIAADDKFLYPYERLYLVASRTESWPEVHYAASKIIALDPYDFPRAYYFEALACLNLNDMDAAEKNAREAVRLDIAANPRAGYVLGVILARKQKFNEASDLLQAYLKVVPNSADTEMVKQQIAALAQFTKQ